LRQSQRAQVLARPIIGLPSCKYSATIMGEKKSAGLRVAARALAAPMLAIFLGFLRSALADLPLGFEWNEPACILRDLVVIGTVIRASIAGF